MYHVEELIGSSKSMHTPAGTVQKVSSSLYIRVDQLMW